MSAAVHFDPDAFMAQRQTAASGGFDPDVLMAQRQAPRPAAPGSDIGHPQLGPSPAMAKVGNLLFQDAANAPKHIMDALSNHPVDSAIQTLQDFTAARQSHMARAVDAFKKGDYQTAATQGFFGSVPFLGPMLGAAADEWTGGHKPEATAHAIETLAPFLGDPAMAGLESQAAAKLGRAADIGAAGVGGGVTGAVSGALKPVTYTVGRGRLNLRIPQSVTGAIAGGAAARALGLPHEAGAVFGAGLPIIQGAYQGAREAIAAKMVGPEVLDAFGQLKYGKDFQALETPQRSEVLTAAQKATGKQPGLPDSVTQDLTRPSEVGPTSQSTPAAGFKAGRESLFPPPAAPAPLPAIGDKTAAMYAAQQQRLNSQATAPTATTTAATVPQPPPEALARLNAGVTTPTRPQNPASAVQPPAAMLSRFNSGVTVNPRATALFDAMRQSGSIPETARPGESFGGEVQPPDKFIARARETRATSAAQLADILHAGGVSSSDLPNITAAEWEALARNKGLGWPIGRPAQAAWTRDVIAALKAREGR